MGMKILSLDNLCSHPLFAIGQPKQPLDAPRHLWTPQHPNTLTQLLVICLTPLPILIYQKLLKFKDQN